MPPILLIQTAFIGDVILATALLEYVAQTAPGRAVDVLVRRGNEGLLTGHPHVRRVLVWDKKPHKYRSLLRMLGQIRAERYGAVVTLQRFASTGLLTALSGAPVRVGFAKNPLSAGFTVRVPHVIGDGTHEVARNLRLLTEGLGLPEPAALPAPRLYPGPADIAPAAEVAGAGPYVCVAPTSVWFTKQWPADRWTALLAALPPHYRVLLLGAPPDAAACEAIAEAARAARPAEAAPVENLAGKLSLLASAALLRGARLTYANDSAPLHLASAVDAPVAAVFCSTVPAFGFGPLSTFRRVIETPEPLACRPCGLHGYAACPLGHFQCATTIPLAPLLAALAEAPSPSSLFPKEGRED